MLDVAADDAVGVVGVAAVVVAAAAAAAAADGVVLASVVNLMGLIVSALSS